ncbi:PIN-like domain-containing protein [Bacillus licheniformis]|uniref:PIN-like domain-containing protein n=1 Tax=Bacillus TaxID=1386 RepID=UPI0022803FA2|nr:MULTISPECIES: PIN domain-containing protein [Bacillus]MCY9352603.1 PIN-like domain-containing protein [Bacillus licheniformis]MEC1550962.1 PIN-like domain-containing protein [Bacillus haynesii]
MADWKRYLYQPRPVSELLKNSTIVIDTNVLLAAYQWREVTVNEVLKTLQQIKEEGRLKIPLQVIKEFSKNRTKEIKQRMNDIDQVISKLQRDKKPVRERVPMLEGNDILKKIEILQENHHKALKEYKDGLVELRDHLKKLFYEDHFLDKVLEIADGAILFPQDGKTDEDLIKEAEERFKNKMPPGYKDDSKEENSSGDYIIWSSILQLDTDVVFVSGDKKTDWVYKDNNENPIVARRELVEEFFMQTGKDFAHVTPKDFITHLNPSVSENVKEDLSSYLIVSESDQKSISSLYKILLLNIVNISRKIKLLCEKYNVPRGDDFLSALNNLVNKGVLENNDMYQIQMLFNIIDDVKKGYNPPYNIMFDEVESAEKMDRLLANKLDEDDDEFYKHAPL